MVAREGLREIERPDQAFNRLKPGEIAGIYRGNQYLLVFHQLHEPVALFLAPAFHELIHNPGAIQVEAKLGVPVNHRDGLVHGPAVDLGDFRIVIGVTDVEMNIGCDEYGPFFCGRPLDGDTVRVVPQLDYYLTVTGGHRLRNFKFQPRFSEIAVAAEILRELAISENERRPCSGEPLPEPHVEIGQLEEAAAITLVVDG